MVGKKTSKFRDLLQATMATLIVFGHFSAAIAQSTGNQTPFCAELRHVLQTLPREEYLCDFEGLSINTDEQAIDWLKVTEALPIGTTPDWVEVDAQSQQGQRMITFMTAKAYARSAPYGDSITPWESFYSDRFIEHLVNEYLATGEIDPDLILHEGSLEVIEGTRAWQGAIEIDDAIIAVMRITYPSTRLCQSETTAYAGRVFIASDLGGRMHFNHSLGINFVYWNGELYSLNVARGRLYAGQLDRRITLDLNSGSIAGDHLCSMSPENLGRNR